MRWGWVWLLSGKWWAISTDLSRATLSCIVTANLKPSIGSIPVLFEVNKYWQLLFIAAVPDSSVLKKTGFANSFQKLKTLTFSAYRFKQLRCKHLGWRHISAFGKFYWFPEPFTYESRGKKKKKKNNHGTEKKRQLSILHDVLHKISLF